MKVKALCEWVSPLEQLTSADGHAYSKRDVKFSFCDEDNWTNSFVATLFNSLAENANGLHSGVVYDVKFRLQAQTARSGRCYLNLTISGCSRNGEEILMNRA